MKPALKYSAAVVGMTVVAVSLALFVAGRCTTEILVVDEGGMPVRDAEVIPQSLSINYSSKTTNGDGLVRLPLVSQPIHWIDVRKNGYQAYRSEDIQHSKRVIVIMKKAPNQAASGNGAIAGVNEIGHHFRAVPDERRWVS